MIAIGDEVACRAHLVKALNEFPKSEHGLTQQMLENKDKQNSLCSRCVPILSRMFIIMYVQYNKGHIHCHYKGEMSTLCNN